MRDSGSTSGALVQASGEAGREGRSSSAASSTQLGAADHDRAPSAPILQPESDAKNLAPGRRPDSPAEAEGRRTLSTAFVRVGPDGHLTVELRDGRALVLRDVIMRPRDYCGVQIVGGSSGAKFCGGYAEVAAARPGGGPALEDRDLTPNRSLEPSRDPARRD